MKDKKSERVDEEVETERRTDEREERSEKGGQRRVQRESSENKRRRRKSYPGFQSRRLVLPLFVFPLLFSRLDLDGSADVSFHNLIVLIKFRRRIALRWAYRPAGHNANHDVYRMNREWNSKWVRPMTFTVSEEYVLSFSWFASCNGKPQIEKLID